MDYFDDVTEAEQNDVLCGATHGKYLPCPMPFWFCFYISDCKQFVVLKYEFSDIKMSVLLFSYRERRKTTVPLRRSVFPNTETHLPER